jgi:hypothetical protein
MAEDSAFSFYLSRSDCPSSSISLLDGSELPHFLKKSLNRRETSESLNESLKRRILLNPFTDECLRTELFNNTECLQESFVLSMAAEAFKTISVRRATKQVQDHTKSFIDWSAIETLVADEIISDFSGGNQDLLNKLKNV